MFGSGEVWGCGRRGPTVTGLAGDSRILAEHPLNWQCGNTPLTWA